MLLDFVPYQINSRAPDGCSVLWFGSEVDIVLVSTSNMNQDNEGSVPSPTNTASQVSETFIANGICYLSNHAWQDVLPEGQGTVACYLC